MAGFSSIDDLINQVTVNSKFWRADWNKATFGTTAHTAGLWYLLSGTGGNPAASTHLGTGTGATNLVYQPCYDFDPTTSGIQHGGPVAADYTGFKTILNASAFSASATTMPCVFMLADMVGYHPITTVTLNTLQTLITTNTFTASLSGSDLLLTYTADFGRSGQASYTPVRVTNSGGALPANLAINTDYWLVRQSATTAKVATSLSNAIAGTFVAHGGNGTGTHTLTVRHPRYGDGAGVQTILVPSTVMGAGTPTVTLTYTNSAGTLSRTTPTSPILPTINATSPVTQVSYSGTGSGKYGPFLPLAQADAGVQVATGITFSATMTSGVQNLVYVKPLLTLPMTTIGVAAERDLVNQLPSMPRVYDGACLVWLMYAGAATPVTSGFFGHLDFGWS